MKTKTKQILSALLALLMLFGALPATVFAAGQTNPLDYLTYRIADGEVTITNCDKSVSGELTIPERIEGYPVTGIGDSAFMKCTGLKNIVIPNSVTDIGWSAFESCTSLTSIMIPDSVTSIGECAFVNCNSLKSIKVSENNMVYDSRNDCNAIICTYENELILGCKNTVIPNNITRIGKCAFDGCTGLTSIIIPDSVVAIGDAAFFSCTELKNITIPDTITSFGECAFADCGKLKSIHIPKCVSEIGVQAFLGCKSLTAVTIPGNVKYISDAFLGCSSITNLTIEYGVETIDRFAFAECTSLTSITIPNSVTDIHYNAFIGCTGLTSIKVSENNKVYDSRNNCNAIIETETNQLIIGCQSTIVPNNIKIIGIEAFAYCTCLTSITIPDSVTSIEECAFEDCTGLTSITIGKGVTSIGKSAFNGCTGLISVTIPDSVTSIGYEAFYDCTSLTVITIPSSVTSIEGLAFGYYYDNDTESYFGKIPNFKIYCYADTAGEQYAKDNGFEYEILKEECAHKLKHITVPASCTVNGMEYDLCTECGDTFNSKVIAASGHSWGNWYISKQPTESADGEETRKCTKCSAIETRKIEKLKTVKDEKTGVEIIYKDEFESGVDLEVSQVFDGKSFQLISANYGDVKSAVFDISTYKDGVKVQPNGKIKVRIPLPQGFGGGNIFVCYVDSENGEVQKIKASVNGGYVEFEAEHFSEYAVVETAPSVKGVDIKDIKLTYKKSGTIKPNITADEGAKYTVKYESSNPKVASVNKNGKVTALKKGTAKITCTVTDSNGNTVSDTCTVTVKYNFDQWLIIILLFGWIWYI